MSNRFKFQLNKSGVRELLRSEEMQHLLSTAANDIRGRCGDGYSSDSYVGTNRANAMVFAETAKAKKDNLKNNTILKAVK